ncbi:hypothetical protein M7I_5535 [Glarea lozoyensis 74030]|nr:hypothetical protein M7I_5535 [Glarea lozoyensis 74030]
MSTLLLLLLTTLIPLTTSYAIIWQPQATITTLQATMVIPQVPAGPGIHFIWPGLQPSSNQYVFQDVSGDDTGIGAWTFADWAVNSV